MYSYLIVVAGIPQTMSKGSQFSATSSPHRQSYDDGSHAQTYQRNFQIYPHNIDDAEIKNKSQSENISDCYRKTVYCSTMLCQLTYPSFYLLGHHSLLLFVVGETSIRAQVGYSHSVQDTRKARFVAICTHLII